MSLEGTLASERSWTSNRLPPTIEKSSVTCATACVDKFRKDSSCNSIMFVKETKECHMGFTSLPNDNETEPTEYVYRIPEGKGIFFGFSCYELSTFLLITFTRHKELVVITKPTKNDSVHSLVASFHMYVHIVVFNILRANSMEFAMAMELALAARLRIEKSWDLIIL